MEEDFIDKKQQASSDKWHYCPGMNKSQSKQGLQEWRVQNIGPDRQKCLQFDCFLDEISYDAVFDSAKKE